MQIVVLDHPLAHHKLALLRDHRTPVNLFRSLTVELGLLLAVEATRTLAIEGLELETPLEKMNGQVLAKLDPALVPVLRAGLGLVPSFLKLLPTAKVGHIGMYRDHASLNPVPYYRNFPPMLDARAVYVLDPMLATGGSASEAIQEVKDAGAKDITLVAIIAAPEGIARLERDHPDLRLVVGAVDRGLDEKGYILPGLGDAGDRIFGTV
ncbi:MAG: uracil phosphoribosyltransferase [Acidobacteriota bacterium]|nr:uracil phosphoribosyltransferase [Acidobacteriota bacterium]